MAVDPVQDPARLAALRKTALLDSPTEEAFDRLTRLAVRLLGAPVALVSLIDADRQFFKSAVGLPESYANARQTPLSHSFCKHTVINQKPLIVPDARHHAVLKDNEAIRDLGVEAYAGFPLTTSGGHALGAFCVIDTHPREWSLDEYEALRDLAALVMAEIELRTTLRERDELAVQVAALASENARQAREKARLQASQAQEKALLQAAQERERTALLDATLHGIYGLDARGCCTYINLEGAHLFGYTPEELRGREMHAAIHHSRADGSPRTLKDDPIQNALSQGRRCRVEDDVFWRRDGRPISVEYSAAPIVVDGQTQGAVVAFAPHTDKRSFTRVHQDMARFTSEALCPSLDALAADLQQLRPTCRGPQIALIQGLTSHLSSLRAKIGELG